MSAGCPSSPLLCLPVPIPSSTAITCICSHWDFSLFRVMLLPYTRLFPRFCLDWSIWLRHWAICVCEMERKGKKGCMELTSECRLRWGAGLSVASVTQNGRHYVRKETNVKQANRIPGFQGRKNWFPKSRSHYPQLTPGCYEAIQGDRNLIFYGILD